MYIFLKRLWKKRCRSKSQNAVGLKGTTAFFISTKNCSNIDNLPLFYGLRVEKPDSAPDFRRVRFFNVVYWKYMSLTSGRSPPFDLIFQKIKRRSANANNYKSLPILLF